MGTEFGDRLRRYRRNARDAQLGGALSQARLADRLSEVCGIVYSRAAVSDWERGKGQIHKDDRPILTSLIRVLVESGGIQTLEQADEWLLAGNYRPLNETEIAAIRHNWLETVVTPAHLPHFFVPALPAHPIIGRNQLLSHLKSHLMSGQNVALSAINGLPGVGKTTMATLLAHDADLHTHFPDGILWVGLGRDPNIYHLLGQWAQAVGIEADALARLGAIQLRANVIHDAIKHKRMLLVIDDAWESAAIEPFKLGGSNCTHILTTRQPPLATAFAGDNALKVETLSEQFAVELLYQLAPSVFDQAPTAARAIVRQTGGLPLALVLVGSYLRQEAISGNQRRIEAALARMQSAESHLYLERPQSILDHNAHPSLDATAPISLHTIIDASFQALTPIAQRALHQLTLFPPKPNSFGEAAALAVTSQSAETLDELVDHGLLEPRGISRYELHQSVHAFASELSPMMEDGKRRIVDFYTAYAGQLSADPAQLGSELENVLATLAHADTLNDPLRQMTLCEQLFPILKGRGLYHPFTTYFEKLANEDLSAVHRAKAQLFLGEIAYKESDLDRALSVWQHGLSLVEAHSADVRLALLSQLSMVTSERQNYTQAIRYLDQAIGYATEIGNWYEQCRALTNRGRVALICESYVEARSFLEQAVTVSTQHRFHSLTCAIYNMLGITAKRQGDMAATEAYFRHGLQVARQQRLTMRVLEQLINLGEFLKEQGKFGEAVAYLEEGVAIARAVDEPSKEAHLLLDLGLIAARDGAYQSVEKQLKTALTLAEKMGDQRLTAHILAQWGMCAVECGQIATAEQKLMSSLQLVPHLNRRGDIEATAYFGLAKLARIKKEERGATAFAERALVSLPDGYDTLREQLLAWLKSADAVSQSLSHNQRGTS